VAELNEPTQQPPPPQEPFTPSERAVKLHDEYRRKIWEDRASGTENFDKYLITFSTGALALSLSFIKDIVPLKDAIWIPLLIVSWVAFILAILATLISFRISLRALENMSPVLDDFYLNGNVDAFNKHLEDPWTKWVDRCASGGILFFVLGLIFTMIFASGNALRANGMAEKDSPAKDNSIRIDRIDFGCKPPAMTPITQNAKPEVKGKDNDLGKGVKPVPMTPIRQTPTPAPPPCPAAPPKK
jgi:hypothetical protein